MSIGMEKVHILINMGLKNSRESIKKDIKQGKVSNLIRMAARNSKENSKMIKEMVKVWNMRKVR